MKHKVEIKSITVYDKYGYHDETEVWLDGKLIGNGGYGGEPEDNYRSRDYDWVEPLLKSLAEQLGADVEITIVDEKGIK